MAKRFICIGVWLSLFLLLAVETLPAQNGGLFRRRNRDDNTEQRQTDAEQTSDNDVDTERRGLFRRRNRDNDSTQGDDQPSRVRETLSGLFRRRNQNGSADAEASDPTTQRALRFRNRMDSLVRPEQDQRLMEFENQFQASLDEGDLVSAMHFLELYEAARDSLVFVQIEATEARERADKQQIWLWWALSGGVLFIGLSGVLFVAFRQKKKHNGELTQKNDALAKANTEIQAQQRKIQLQHQDIVESITYARRIQEAILPAIQHVAAAVPDSFVLYRPKDIVSGDFFWFHQGKDWTYIAAVDCTGHGVPGAFMSVLGMSLLNQAVAEAGRDLAPDELLNVLHAGVIQNLRQMENSTQQDGMDIALVAISADRRTLRFAGAHNPLYVLHPDSELEEIKGDKAPIGGKRFVNHRFDGHEINMQKGSIFYVFSDGLADQFGGPKGKKFTYKQLRSLMLAGRNLPMAEQGSRLGKTFTDWRGEIEQIDDVLVIGARV